LTPSLGHFGLSFPDFPKFRFKIRPHVIVNQPVEHRPVCPDIPIAYVSFNRYWVDCIMTIRWRQASSDRGWEYQLNLTRRE